MKKLESLYKRDTVTQIIEDEKIGENLTDHIHLTNKQIKSNLRKRDALKKIQKKECGGSPIPHPLFHPYGWIQIARAEGVKRAKMFCLFTIFYNFDL